MNVIGTPIKGGRIVASDITELTARIIGMEAAHARLSRRIVALEASEDRIKFGMTCLAAMVTKGGIDIYSQWEAEIASRPVGNIDQPTLDFLNLFFRHPEEK